MSHSSLLRLAESPHWTLQAALEYLALYSDNIGITYYIVRRLHEQQLNDVKDLWGIICHLLISRPSQSAALENYVLDLSEKSTHITSLTLWFMQAHLRDLSLTHRETKQFAVCQRVIQKCHELIYGDVTLHTTPTGQPPEKLPSTIVAPHFVGLGALLASVAMSSLAVVGGEMSVQQARHGDGTQHPPPARGETPINSPAKADIRPEDDEELLPPVELSSSPEDKTLDLSLALSKPHTPISRVPTPITSARASTTSLVEYPPVTPSIDISSFSRRTKPRKSSANTTLNQKHLPSRSTPSLGMRVYSQTEDDGHSLSHLQQHLLLRKHYLQSQIDFVLSLEKICHHLVKIPKPARVSVLRAQLTSLNHRLPIEACPPLGCPACALEGADNHSTPHHRIVRIPAGECVALNSAERAPFLLLVEYLEGDLSFDPSKRSNKALLNKLVERDASGLHSSYSNLPTPTPHGMQTPTRSQSAIPNGNAAEVTSPVEFNDEEIDVVEQVYGASERLSWLDEPDLIKPPVSTPLKNRDLEAAAWSSTAVGQRSRDSPPTESRVKHPVLEDLTFEEYGERMNTAAAMLAQLNAALSTDLLAARRTTGNQNSNGSAAPSTWPWSPPNPSSQKSGDSPPIPDTKVTSTRPISGTRLQRAEAEAIRDRIMREMNLLEEERMRRMRVGENDMSMSTRFRAPAGQSETDEDIIRKELKRDDPSAVIFSEDWQEKKSRIRSTSPYGHLANWNCVSMIVKTGADLRQEQLAVQLVEEFARIFKAEHCRCYLRPFQVIITGSSSGLVETITDAVSIHSIKKALYAGKLASNSFEQVTLMDHFVSTYGESHTTKFIRAQRNFAQSLAGYSLVTYFLQIKDRHNGNILLDREGHLIHIDFGFMLTNSPGNLGFEAAPFKLPLEYVEVLGGIESDGFREFQQQFHAGFEAVRKHSHQIVALVELMQKDSSLPCFTALREQTSAQLKDRFLTQSSSSVAEHVDKLIMSSIGSAWTRLYDSYQYYSQSIF